MHRLFLGISGVADQLQSNHANELRVILKHVFTVCQSEPDTPLSAVLCGSSSGAGHAGYEENNSLEPCTPEPQSPLITDSQSTYRIILMNRKVKKNTCLVLKLGCFVYTIYILLVFFFHCRV